ncbi:bifunctional 4-hydroxy-2-oxoglutarate aldolase/2-dehydro-3-deoxy-phosphogluconate aldolase [uncultured Tyzzerella sp.]|uniref:bifunctional 4-hydroxy-2-oxoglutarate aldolase/2-dehydro-3-deoxy-phosphogluconate aldolase n=1 Tax=uncultured Tyzzerella sp. TaxID=2321398 RepID=UPI002941FCC9|nr:bifunctional 4-hydroxy-2-oxoglutarate aldolase/2-dehydro-3-deoxy-phosphogluconate aldolase [uncultured Tyzzerella sp.]
MEKILKKLSAIGIIPVVTINDIEKAIPLAKTLVDSGIHCVEITFRTEQAEDAIKRITSQVPKMLVGAGTVLNTEQADKAINAGAKFLISPGLNPTVVKHCIEKNYFMIPGIATPSDIESAINLGVNVVKFFPAEAAGGINMIKSMSLPYYEMRFIPTGGINNKNLNDYLSFDKVICCGGSFIINDEYIKENKFDKIRKLCKYAIFNMLGFEIDHVGINTKDNIQADKIAKEFSKLFNFSIYENDFSIFLDNSIEVMKSVHLGRYGHIAIKTNYIERAINYIEAMGGKFDISTIKEENGKIKSIFLKEDIGEYAIQIVQK